MDAGTSVIAEADTGSGEDWRPWASSWTAPAALDRLAHDCRYSPPHEGGPDFDPLVCEADIDPQWCSEDPCHDRFSVPCNRLCGSACARCDDTCRTACEGCHRACHDDACRRTCALTCGGCLQGCLRDKDRCLTGECAVRYRQCRVREAERFNRSPCAPACTRCHANCQESEDINCLEHCLAATPRCTGGQATLCSEEGPNVGARFRDAGSAGP